MRDKGRLEDIVEYSHNVMNFVEGISFEELMNDKLRYYAVMKNVEIVGEAAYMLTKDFKREHPDTPWAIYRVCVMYWYMIMHVSVLILYTIRPKRVFPSCVNRWSVIWPIRTGTNGSNN